jgi:protein-disulfide isomerase
LPRIVKAYVEKGKLLIAFRHLPLEAIHAEAAKAAEAAECSGLQGKFWEMHDALFRDVRQLGARTHADRASEVGLDVPQFSKCLQGDRATRVQADLADARRLGIARTPTFLFGTGRADGSVTIVQRESGALPYSVFSGIVEKLLATSKTASR